MKKEGVTRNRDVVWDLHVDDETPFQQHGRLFFCDRPGHCSQRDRGA